MVAVVIVIAKPSDPDVLYVPPNWLQSAAPESLPSSWNTTSYFGWSAAGMMPWKAGTFSVIAVSCQCFEVSGMIGAVPRADRSGDGHRVGRRRLRAVPDHAARRVHGLT